MQLSVTKISPRELNIQIQQLYIQHYIRFSKIKINLFMFQGLESAMKELKI